MRNRLAESDPDRSTPKRQPISLRIESIGPENYARSDRHAGHVRERRYAGAKWRAFQQRARAITNAAFGKNTDDSAIFQTLNRGPDRFAIGPIARGWKSIHCAQK